MSDVVIRWPILCGYRCASTPTEVIATQVLPPLPDRRPFIDMRE
jgi:hypothetical protein